MAIATSTAMLLGAGATAGAGILGAKKDREAAKDINASQADQQLKSREFIERMQKQARGDLFKLFPEAQESRQKGIDAGFDLFKQTIPMQMNQFKQGNIAAQEQLQRGLPGIESAFLGTGAPMDMQTYQADMGKYNFQLPQMPTFSPIAPAQGGIEQTNIDPRLLFGNGYGN